MEFHTMIFGRDHIVIILEEMEEVGNGYFEHCLDKVKLT